MQFDRAGGPVFHWHRRFKSNRTGGPASILRLPKPTSRDGGPFLFHQQVSNDAKGITEFLKALRLQTKASIDQCLFCLEHTATADRGHLQ
jgi:hypothetical protein